MVITPSEYYRARFADTPFAHTFANWLIVTYNCTAIFFQGAATKSLPATTPAKRIARSGILLLICFLTFTLITAFGPGNTPDPRADTRAADIFYFFALLFCANTLAAACSYFQNAVVALSSAFGPFCMGTMLSFQGIIAVVVSVIQLAAAVSFARSHPLTDAVGAESVASESSRATIVFFVISVMLMAVVLAAFRVLVQTDLFWEVHYKEAGSSSWARVEGDHEQSSEGGASWELLSRLGGKVWYFCLAMVLNFVVTLALFPTVTSRVTSSTAPKGTLLGSPLVFASIHFVLFNFSDVVGRTLPSFLPAHWLPSRSASVLAFALSRIVFVPLFQRAHMGGAVDLAVPEPSLSLQGNATSVPWAARAVQTTTVPLLQQDWVFFSLLFLFGASNGYLITSLFVNTPSHPALDFEEKRLAASVLSFWLAIGLALGSAFSFAVDV